MLLVVAVASLPLLVYSIAGYRQDRADAYAATERSIRSLLQSALVPEAMVVDNVRQVLRIMANAGDLRSGNRSDCEGLAIRLMKTQANFANLGVALPSGELFCSGVPSKGPVDVSDRAWFKDALARGDLTGGSFVVGRVTGQPGVIFAYPLLDMNNVPRMVLFGSLRLEWINKLVAGAPIAPGWVAAAYAADGSIIARHPDTERLVGTQLAAEEALMRLVRSRPGETIQELSGPDGVRRIFGIAPMASSGGDIYLVIGAPVDVVFGAIDSRFKRSLMVSLLVALASFLLAWVTVHRSFLRFSDALIRAGERVTQGDLTARVGAGSSVIELRRLLEGFDRMAEQLETLDARHRADQSNLLVNAERLRELNATLDGVINSSDAVVYIFDIEGRCLLANRSFSRLVGRSVDGLLGQPREAFLPAEVARQHRENDQRVLALGRSITIEETSTGATGERIYLSVKFPLRDGNDAIYAVGGISTDITEHKALDEKVQQLLNFDALTGLPNRTLFMDRLQQALIAARRSKGGVALFSIDLVRFRIFNDTLGQATGDAVLAEVGRRLAETARAGDSVARLSSDEFALVMADFEQESDITLLAQRVLEAITHPLRAGDSDLAVAANIGISVFGKDGESAEELLKAADAALARAKQSGRNLFRFFAAGMDVDAERRLMLEAELRSAVGTAQLEMHYQPQVDLSSGRVAGTEALMRWTHPVIGSVSPVEFIPLAEETGLILPLGAWALREACQQNKAWLDEGLPAGPVAVNLSARQFHQADLVDVIRDTLAETGLPPALLELELTESAFIGDAATAIGIVHRIKELGVLLALDDFGTGYSSLSYLSGFPFDKIKIDQSFVRDITTNPVNAAIATATIAMARSLDLVTLAEGVETEAQMRFLRARQCEAMQGWLFSKALPVGELTALLRAGQSLKVGAGETATPTLLLVDDEPGVLNALHRLLRRDGYKILMADGPAQAFELLAQHEVQVIVSDQRMPEMNGTEFLSRAKRLYPNTVRIILSGYTDVESITDAINRGAIYHFMTKPWDDEKLRTEIHEAFRVAAGFSQG